MSESIPPELFDNTDVAREIIDAAVLIPEIGFAGIRQEGGVRILGFHAHHEIGVDIVPQVELHERPPDKQALDANAKGVGIYLGNSAPAMLHLTKEGRARSIGVYMTDMFQDEEMLAIQSNDTTSYLTICKGLVRHAGLKGVEKMTTSKTAIDLIERRNGDAAFVSMDPAPTWIWKQRKLQYPIPPVWGLNRDKQRRPLRYIGRALNYQ